MMLAQMMPPMLTLALAGAAVLGRHGMRRRRQALGWDPKESRLLQAAQPSPQLQMHPMDTPTRQALMGHPRLPFNAGMGVQALQRYALRCSGCLRMRVTRMRLRHHRAASSR